MVLSTISHFFEPRQDAATTLKNTITRSTTTNKSSSETSVHSEIGGDVVELSPNAPRPLSAQTVLDADQIARIMANKDSLSPSTQTRLREDRVLAAMVTLSALNLNGTEPFDYWPGGLPQPNGPELTEAYRRLRQRLSGTESLSNSHDAERIRIQLSDRFRQTNFAKVADMLGG